MSHFAASLLLGLILIEQVDRLSRLDDAGWETLRKQIADKQLAVVSLDLPTSHLALTCAVSDMKKAIDYSEDLEESPQFPGTESYLRTLYEQHKRKTPLWPLMADKIQGLSVGKDGGSYITFRLIARN